MLHSFDIVLAVEVIEHLLYPKELAKAAKKSLNPGGQLIIFTPYHGYLKKPGISYFRQIRQTFYGTLGSWLY